MRIKKKFFKVLLGCLIILLALPEARAARVNAARAEQIATRHVKSRHKKNAKPKIKLKHSQTRGRRHEKGPRNDRLRNPSEKKGKKDSAAEPIDPTAPSYYIFDENESEKGGFVVVAGDDLAHPVLGWSDNGNYDENDMSPEFAYWMDFLQDQIEQAQDKGVEQSPEVAAEWEQFQSGGDPVSAASQVGPFVQTKWGQREPYNNMCPLYNGSRSITGCVATAMAQVMNFHKWPAVGTGSTSSYTTSSLKISVPAITLNVAYDWDYMADTYNHYYDSNGTLFWLNNRTQRQNDAVATLMYHVGASVKMDYTPSESSAYSDDVPTALRNRFGYDTSVDIKHRSKYTWIITPSWGQVSWNYSDSEWEGMLKTEFDAGRPVYYSGRTANYDGGGHAFVCDGYNSSNEFHFNWGWNGLYDGWYRTEAMPSEASYNHIQAMVTGIKPPYIAVTGVSLNKSTVKLENGAYTTITATIAPSNATNKSVSWTSSNTSTARPYYASTNSEGINYIDAYGDGTATITAKAAGDTSKTAACAVTVRTTWCPSGDWYTACYGDGTYGCQTSAAPYGTGQTGMVNDCGCGSNMKILWRCSATSGTTSDYGNPVTADGSNCWCQLYNSQTGTLGPYVYQRDLITAPTCASGSCADWCADYIGKTSTIFREQACSGATTNGIPATGLSLDKTSMLILPGTSEKLTSTITPWYATRNWTDWSSDNTAIATVASDGTVSAVAQGTTLIRATSGDGLRTASCAVTVPYRITYVMNGGAANGGDWPATYTPETATITLGTLTRAASTFRGWYGESDFGGNAITSIPTGSSGDRVFYAKWTCHDGYYGGGAATCARCPGLAEPNGDMKYGASVEGANESVDDCTLSYGISYVLNNGGADDELEWPASYTTKTPTFALPVPSRANSTFRGWYEESNFSGAAITEIPYGSKWDKTFYAKWTCQSGFYGNSFGHCAECPGMPAPDGTMWCGENVEGENETIDSCILSYDITYELNGGAAADEGDWPRSYTPETPTITLGTPTRANSTFRGWYGESDFSGAAITEIPTGSSWQKTFYAKWTCHSGFYGTSAAPCEECPEVAGEDETPRRGENAEGANATADSCVILPDATYDIIYELNGGAAGGGIWPDAYTPRTPTITLGIPTRTSSVFMGWYETENFTGSVVTEIPYGSTGDKTFYAKWFCLDGYYVDSATTCNRCPHMSQ